MQSPKLITTLIQNTLVAIAIGMMASPLVAEDTTRIPYKKLGPMMTLGDSKKIGEIECTPLYLNHTNEGDILNPKVANFRLQTKNGVEAKLTCEALSGIPEARLTATDKLAIEDGSTHRLWIPKDAGKHAGSELIWDLPKGSIHFSAAKAIPFKIPLNPLAAPKQKKPDRATRTIFRQAEELRKGEKFDEAAALLTEALANGNDHVVLHMSLATTYALQKKFKPASNSYKVAWTRTRDSRMLEGYAVSLAQIKDLKRLREIKGDLIENFGKLKEGRFALFMIVVVDNDRNLFDRAIVKIPAQDIKEDQKLAAMLALTSQKLAQDQLQDE